MKGWAQASSPQYFFRYIPPHWLCLPSQAVKAQGLFLDSDFKGLEIGKEREGGSKRGGGEKTEEEPQAPGPRREEGRRRRWRGLTGGGGGRREMTRGERKTEGEVGRVPVEWIQGLAAASGPPET